MANHLYHLLHQWYPKRDQQQWVLATVTQTQGSAYRKSGAHMLINDLGQYWGMLSGGCLEADIIQQARRCWDSGLPRMVEYDLQQDSDLGERLGLGCGGAVQILLQIVDGQNQYQGLDQIYRAMADGQTLRYVQSTQLDSSPPINRVEYIQGQSIEPNTTNEEVVTLLRAPYHLAVLGAGRDAQPLVEMAAILGWRVTVVDPRTSHGRSADFPKAHAVLKEVHDEQIKQWQSNLDAAVIMHHQLDLDSQALGAVWATQAKFIGVLGPSHRTEKLLEKLNKTPLDALKRNVVSPVGLRLGGELPESIALSILAQIHAVLEEKDAKPLYATRPQ